MQDTLSRRTTPNPRLPAAMRGDPPETLKAAVQLAYLSFNDLGQPDRVRGPRVSGAQSMR